MMALTVCQPYAELIARGIKTVENRTWPTRYRGQLAIHAGKSQQWREPDLEAEFKLPAMEFGAVIAVARLTDVVSYTDIPFEHGALVWDRFASGPWCWVLKDVVRLEAPVPERGRPRLWPVDEVAEYLIRAAMPVDKSLCVWP